MQSQDFISSFTVSQSPGEVFAAIVDVRRWWTGDVQGITRKLGGEFTYRYEDAHYSKLKVTELIPGQKVAWMVTDAYLRGHDDPGEWTGTEITFEIAPRDGQTELRFAHLGLAPELECFESCSNAWGFYVNGGLRRLITTGDGPTPPPWVSA